MEEIKEDVKRVEIPLLNAKDVDLRPAQVFPAKEGKPASVLMMAYKDARVDMRILDQVFGWNNWERSHDVIDGQLFCTVKVWDEQKGQWIAKQDVGVESKSEAEKGRASDSFKRACFNFGIGRELYDTPPIWVNLNNGEYYQDSKGRWQLARTVGLRVKEMKFEKMLGEFSVFTVVDAKGNVRFALDKKKIQQPVADSNSQEQNKDIQQQAEQKHQPYKMPEGPSLTCSNCKDSINAAESDYSRKHFGKNYCRKCQNLARGGKI